VATPSPDASREIAFSDTWVLAAVAYAGGKSGADLASIVATADYMNHAVLTYDEASGSLARLSAAGLIRVVRGKLAASARVLAVLPKGRTAVHKDLERIAVFLRSQPTPRRLKSALALSRAAFDDAVKSYLASVRVR
jgi:DNA-binding MarR family transcriptional regulator